jgi:CubicO group peptidase (beta-lactamase class C family)
MPSGSRLLLVLVALLPLAAQAQPPAERQFRAWLAAFNSGDRAELLGFLEREFPSHGTGTNQQFQPVPEGNGYHHFVARHSGKCLEVRGGSSADDVPLEQRACHGGAAQSFQLTPVSGTASSGDTGGIVDGAYKVVNKNSGKCVEAGAAAIADGTVVRQKTCEATPVQVWQLATTGSGYFRVQAANDKTRGWDVDGGPEAIADGTKLHLWRNVQDPDGMFRFRTMTGGFELKKAEESTPTKFVALLQERDSDQFARFTVEVEPAEPHRLTRLDGQATARPAEFAIPPLAENDLVAALRTKLAKDTAGDRFAGAVMVSRNGRTVFSGAYGLADRERKIPNTLNTRFRIGSMNKMFTGTAVLQLVQAGKIKLEDPVGKYLTDYPNRDIAAKVTIHHLLTHTGGTGDFFGPEFDAHRRELRTLQDYVKLFGARGPGFEPGSRWSYSNYGMLLLGVIIERASGVGYYDYVQDHIFKPAGMTGTASLSEDEVVADRSVGYMNRDGAWKPNTDTLPYRGTSAGGGYSTVEDLVRFANALTSHRLLNAHYTDLLTTGKVETGGGGKYAYGFNESVVQGVRSFGHGGGAPGMNGDLRIYPQSGYVIAVLSNLDPPAAGRVSQFIASRLPAGASD